jgi:hypothetical protein
MDELMMINAQTSQQPQYVSDMTDRQIIDSFNQLMAETTVHGTMEERRLRLTALVRYDSKDFIQLMRIQWRLIVGPLVEGRMRRARRRERIMEGSVI